MGGGFGFGEEVFRAVGEFAGEGGVAGFVGEGWSWFESGEKANDDSIGAAVGKVAIGDEDHEE